MNMTLLIMAAGMGSRFGGIKQIEPVGAHNELIIDYSIYDAKLAGFNKVVFIIRREIEKDFCESIFNRIKNHIDAEYVFQDLDDLPSGFTLPKERTKPWGTAHAILAARDVINAPFCVVNADDFYGRTAYQKIADFFRTLGNKSNYKYAMVGYKLENTISEKGSVSRGICEVDQNSMVTEIVERLRIEKRNQILGYTLDGNDFYHLRPDSDASMNIWGFTPDIMPVLQQKFIEFLRVNSNELKTEYPIPTVIGDLLKEDKITLRMLDTNDQWLGFTYPEDKTIVKSAIEKLNQQQIYPSPLWKK